MKQKTSKKVTAENSSNAKQICLKVAHLAAAVIEESGEENNGGNGGEKAAHNRKRPRRRGVKEMATWQHLPRPARYPRSAKDKYL